MSVHANIRRLRAERNMTLEQVGKFIGTSKQTVQRYENGEIANIPYDKITSLAKCFKVSPAEIMGWSEEAPQPGTSMEHIELIGMYENLTDEQKIAIKNMMASMIK